MSKNIIECPYCKSIITEKDSTCPKCGANCTDAIKDFHKKQEEEEKRNKEEMIEKSQKLLKEMMPSVKIPFTIISIISVTIIIAVISLIIIFSFDFKKPRKKELSGTINEIVEKDTYTIRIDSYEAFEYYDDFFKNCNTKEGYQKVAFHFVIENTSDDTLSTRKIVNTIELKAEDELVNKAELKADTHFCEVLQGKEEYNTLPSSNIISGDKLSGYIGFEIPENKEVLKFIVEDSVLIEMDNPIYKAEE